MTDETGTDRVGYYAAWSELEPGAAPYGENVSRALAAEAFADARQRREAEELAGQAEDRQERLEVLGRGTTLGAVFARATRDGRREDYRDDRERLRREDDLRRADFPLPDRLPPRADLDLKRADVMRSARRTARVEAEAEVERGVTRTAAWDARQRGHADRAHAGTHAGRWVSAWTRGA